MKTFLVLSLMLLSGCKTDHQAWMYSMHNCKRACNIIFQGLNHADCLLGCVSAHPLGNSEDKCK